jgi:hypothetical protein
MFIFVFHFALKAKLRLKAELFWNIDLREKELPYYIIAAPPWREATVNGHRAIVKHAYPALLLVHKNRLFFAPKASQNPLLYTFTHDYRVCTNRKCLHLNFFAERKARVWSARKRPKSQYYIYKYLPDSLGNYL